ncbi:MAG TPA: serine hydrolase [Gaiella sp.]|nr:serine hydrolase [Gaiella sp.]
MIDSPPPPPPHRPPAIVRPAPYQASYGLIEGQVAPGTERVVVRVGGRVVGDVRPRARKFTADVDLPAGELTVRVESVDGTGRRAESRVRNVLGLPRAARPRIRTLRLDPALQRDLRRLAGGFPGTSAMYVESLTTGSGAGWNARATFPAASTLKLAIAVTLLSRTSGPPTFGTALDRTMRGMLIASDNIAANRALVWLGGSTSGGGHLVNAAMGAIGLERTEMYGGFLIGTSRETLRGVAARGIPLNVVDQPSWGVGKATTAQDLAQLHRVVWLASGGLGPRVGLDPGEARYLLYLLARAQPHSKLGRVTHRRPGVVVLHKAGWVDAARHDAGLVAWRGGVYVAAVMTYRSTGAGRGSDVLAGQVAERALRRFRG